MQHMGVHASSAHACGHYLCALGMLIISTMHHSRSATRQSRVSSCAAAGEIAKIALARSFIKVQGKTPEATMASALYTDVKRRGADGTSTFVRPQEGLFGLRAWGNSVGSPAAAGRVSYPKHCMLWTVARQAQQPGTSTFVRPHERPQPVWLGQQHRQPCCSWPDEPVCCSCSTSMVGARRSDIAAG